eukprot:239402-Rhodomonas_salina.5
MQTATIWTTCPRKSSKGCPSSAPPSSLLSLLCSSSYALLRARCALRGADAVCVPPSLVLKTGTHLEVPPPYQATLFLRRLCTRHFPWLSRYAMSGTEIACAATRQWA